MYTKILAVYCGNYSGIRAKEPSGSLAVLGKKVILEPCEWPGFHTFYQNLDIENTASDIFLSLTCYGGLAPFLSKFQQMQYVNAACRNKTLGSYPHILTSDVYFCPACWSDAPVYYRRHQMPGVCVCNKHHCLLHYYNSKHQETVCTPNASQAIMEKYATFAADLLRLQPDADIQATKSVIFQVIKERGYYTPADNAHVR